MANYKGKGKTKVKGQSATRVISQAGGVTLRARKTKNGESLYLDYMLLGERIPEFLELYLVNEKTPLDKAYNKEILAQAEAIRAQRQIDLPSMKHNFIPQYKLKINFIDFMRSEGANKSTKSTSAMWKSVTNKVIKFNGGNEQLPFNKITAEWVEDLKDFLSGEMPKINSAVTYYETVVTAIKAAKAARIIKEDPSEHVKPLQGEDVLREFHTPDEVNMLFHTPCDHPMIKRAYLFGCLSGLRSIDLFSLTRDRIETVTLPNGSTEYRIKLIQQKVTDALYLTISKECYELAGEAQTGNAQERIFPLYSDHELRLKLRAWVHSAGIKKHVGWHTARHTNAVILLINGVDIFTISKRLGHKNITTTQRYLHIVDVQMQKAANISILKPPALTVAA